MAVDVEVTVEVADGVAVPVGGAAPINVGVDDAVVAELGTAVAGLIDGVGEGLPVVAPDVPVAVAVEMIGVVVAIDVAEADGWVAVAVAVSVACGWLVCGVGVGAPVCAVATDKPPGTAMFRIREKMVTKAKTRASRLC